MARLVSIVIPTYERPVFALQAVKSCLAQDHPALEIVVVDDSSTDDTGQSLAALNDPRIVYVRNHSRIGMTASFNAGFARARGEYLTWSSDDDVFLPGAIAAMARVLDDEADIDFVYADYGVIDQDGKFLHPGRVEDPEGLDRDNYVGHCFLYRRKVYAVIGDYRPAPLLVEDYEYWLRVRRKFRMRHIPGILYHHRTHPGCLTVLHGPDAMLDAVAKVRRPYIAAWKHHFYVGELCYHRGLRRAALGQVVLSLVFWPWHRPSWRLLALLVLPERMIAWIRRRR